MWKSKKFYIPVIIAAIIAGSIGSAVLADEGVDNEHETAFAAMWDRVAAIYEENTGDTLDTEALQDAMKQAQEERQAEAMQNRLDELVEEGKITQEEADQIQEWYDSRPDVLPGLGLPGHDGGPRGMMGGMPSCGGPCASEDVETQDA